MTELPKTQATNHEAEIISELVKHVNAAKHRLRIFSGEANCNVYNRLEVEAALKRAYERGVRIQIIAGPILSICPGSNYRSAILEMAQRQEIELYLRSRRSTEPHFCLTDDKMGVCQHHHPPMSRYDKLPEAIPLNKLPSYIEKFERWIATGIGTYNGSSFTVHFSHNPKRDFLLLNEAEIDRVSATAEKRSNKLDDLTREEIAALLTKGGSMRSYISLDSFQFILLSAAVIFAALGFSQAVIADRGGLTIWALLTMVSTLASWALDRYSQRKKTNTSPKGGTR